MNRSILTIFALVVIVAVVFQAQSVEGGKKKRLLAFALMSLLNRRKVIIPFPVPVPIPSAPKKVYAEPYYEPKPYAYDSMPYKMEAYSGVPESIYSSKDSSSYEKKESSGYGY